LVKGEAMSILIDLYPEISFRVKDKKLNFTKHKKIENLEIVFTCEEGKDYNEYTQSKHSENRK